MAGVHGARVLYLVTEDYYFWSHRLPVARAARDNGARVFVAAREQEHGDRIRAEGFEYLPLRQMRRRSVAPAQEAAALAEIVSIYRQVKPDLVHNVALKPVIYGSIAARVTRVPAVVNALAGLGAVFAETDNSRRTRLRTEAIKLAFKATLPLPNSVVLLQNPDNVRLLVEAGIVPANQVAMIRGSGVDIDDYAPRPAPQGRVRVLYGGRLLRIKGIEDFYRAAQLLKEWNVPCDMLVAGGPDPENPSSLDAATLEAWAATGAIEYLGQQANMAERIGQCHIACLPSHGGEGVPKYLLEAASCARPVVTTDTDGCREVCDDGVTGIRVPPADPTALAQAIRRLVESPELRASMGAAGRTMVERELSTTVVCRLTMELYGRLLAAAGR